MSRPEPSESFERDRIVAAARRLVETGGVDALSMRKLAAELGVAHTAIYWHVGGRDELIGAVVESFLADLGDITPKGRSPRQRTASIAREIRRQVVDHPALVNLAIEHGRFAAMWFPAQVALAREVSAAGLGGVDAARAVTSLLYLAGAFVMLEAALADHAGDAQAVSQLWRTVNEPAIDKALRTRMAKSVEVASVFEDVLEAVLDWTFPTTRST
ncbi:MAG: helix-turn-helix domain-containing protein [Acidimicrobiia bacterium]